MLYYAIGFCSQCLHHDGEICADLLLHRLIAELHRSIHFVGIEIIPVRSF